VPDYPCPKNVTYCPLWWLSDYLHSYAIPYIYQPCRIEYIPTAGMYVRGRGATGAARVATKGVVRLRLVREGKLSAALDIEREVENNLGISTAESHIHTPAWCAIVWNPCLCLCFACILQYTKRVFPRRTT
jgi:hypothetical protein